MRRGVVDTMRSRLEKTEAKLAEYVTKEEIESRIDSIQTDISSIKATLTTLVDEIRALRTKSEAQPKQLSAPIADRPGVTKPIAQKPQSSIPAQAKSAPRKSALRRPVTRISARKQVGKKAEPEEPEHPENEEKSTETPRLNPFWVSPPPYVQASQAAAARASRSQRGRAQSV